MENRLRAGLQVAADGVGVGVTAEEQQLKKQHARRPHAGPAAEPREDVFTDERLDLEEEERTGEDGEGEGGHEGISQRAVNPREDEA